MTVVKPLLAVKADYGKIKYPVLATPKLDGIRCLIVEGEAKSRKMKPIPNEFVRKELQGLPELDGELMVQGDFNAVQSGIMKTTGEPDFIYHVFDTFVEPDKPYSRRIGSIDQLDGHHHRIRIVRPILIHNEEALELYLENCLSKGYEGVMIRDPNGVYKFGRSTVNQGILLKVKRFLDAEGILVSVTEKMHNNNPKEKDELGNTKRSSCKEFLVPADTAGACVMSWNGKDFSVGFGPGWTDEKKKDFWTVREHNIGKAFTFRYQELSKDGIPRFGKLIGFRHPDDIS